MMKRKPVTAWERHSLLCFCESVFNLLVRELNVDIKNVRKYRPKLRRLVASTWREVVDSCVLCNKPMRLGAGLTVKKGWRIHRRCARKKNALE